MRTNWKLLMAIIMLGLTGCGSPAVLSAPTATLVPVQSTPISEKEPVLLEPGGAASPTPGFLETPSLEETPEMPISIDAGLQNLIDKAKVDLARRLSVGETEIRLVEAAQVTWPDAGLGCAKPGASYTQVVTPGFKLVFESGGKNYFYHTNTKEQVVFCPSLQADQAVTPTTTVDR